MRTGLVAVLCVEAVFFIGCAFKPSGSKSSPGPSARYASFNSWRVEEIARVSSLAVPECAAVDAASGNVYISNIDAPKEGPDNRYNTDDNRGFITRLKPGGELSRMRWVQSEVNAPINSIKGLCVLRGVIYACDVDHVRRISTETGQALEPICIHGAEFLNDAATDGKYVYVSDSNTDKIHRLDGDEYVDIPAPKNPNGIAFSGGRMYVVSWAAHEIYEVDMDGISSPRPMGLADHFAGLDGVEILADGTFMVSDQKQNRIALVSADFKRVRTLVEVAGGPADFGVDPIRGMLYVPLIWADSAVAYKLTNSPR